MSTSYTPNLKLAQPALGDTGWNVQVNGNTTLLDGLTSVAHLSVTMTEIPSASLDIKVAAGAFILQDGSVNVYAGASSTAMTASSTNSVWLTAAGVLTVGTSGFPSTPHVRLAVVVAGTSTITSVTDARKCFPAVGPFADGINLSFGTSTGTQIGTATSQKIGFFGKTPIVQPTIGAGTASGSYTSVEQGMLQAVYNAVRSLGLGS